MLKDNEVLDRLVQGCERLEQEPEWRKSKTVHLLRGDWWNTRLKSWCDTLSRCSSWFQFWCWCCYGSTQWRGDRWRRRQQKKNPKENEQEESKRRSKNDEEKEMFKAGMEEQCKDMSSFMANFNWVQEQQLNTMNTLVGALTNFF